MKFNFRKIASVLASTVMLSSTVALAAASTYSEPFVSNGVADVAVVYGASAPGGFDSTAALDITANLNSKLIASSGTVTTVSGGDFFKLEKSTNKFNLGETFTDIETSLNEDELSNVLAAGVYEDNDGTEYDYDQKITLGSLNLTHFADEDVDADEKPVIGFNVVSGTHVLNYTLDFIDSVENSSTLLETTNLEMLGRVYYISDWVPSDEKMTLLDTANTATVYSSSPVSLLIGATEYNIELISVNGDDEEAILKVNGVEYDAIKEGNSRKVSADTYLSVLDLKEATRESDDHWVKISIGTGQIILHDGQDLEVNEDSVDGLAVDFTITNNELDKIVLDWTADEDSFIVPGMDMVLPGFETIKLSMGNFIRSDLEEMTVTNNGDDYMEVSGLDIEDGSITLPVLYSNDTKTGFAGIGKDATHLLVTNATASPIIRLNESQNTKFVATWVSSGTDDWESSAFEVDSISEIDSGVKNETKLKNLADGTTITLTDTGSGDDTSVGELTFTISGVNGDLGIASLRITADSGTAYADRVVTKGGLSFLLPVALGSSSGSNINLTANPASWYMNFTEADDDNNIGTGIKFYAKLGHTTDKGPEVDTVSLTTLETTSGSDDEEAYVGGPKSHATKLLFKTGGDNDVLDVEYPGSEAYAEVYISETAAAVTAEGGVKVLAITDAESTSAKNLIVVGGSCVNSVAADLLGGALCGAEFEAKTGVGAGSFLIQTFAQDGGGVATLVAGYNAQDTINGAKYLTTQTVDTSVGKKYKGTTATSASIVVA